jgi:hypothetical protein
MLSFVMAFFWIDDRDPMESRHLHGQRSCGLVDWSTHGRRRRDRIHCESTQEEVSDEKGGWRSIHRSK